MRWRGNNSIHGLDGARILAQPLKLAIGPGGQQLSDVAALL